MSRKKKKLISLFRTREKLREIWGLRKLPNLARREYFIDHLGIINNDPGCQVAIDSSIAWLCRAQDNNALGDDGAADAYNMLSGWGPSYPETTGYIIPTLINYARLKDDKEILQRARRMVDWLCSIQLPDGSFQGGVINALPLQPTVFNTGQIVMGLAAGVKEFGDVYRESLIRAADWLVKVQDPDGAWRKFESPFVVPGDKTYHTHVAWGLLEAERVEPNRGYGQAALANIYWALSHQRSNGWFANCDLNFPHQPLTHTLGYVLRGVIEGHLFSPDPKLLEASRLTADGLLGTMEKDGYIAGRLYEDWKPVNDWVCVTGTVQLAICWFLLYEITGESRYRDAAYVTNRYVRRRVSVKGADYKRGGVKGAYPVNGQYGAFSYLNWAAKFFVDANMLEIQVRLKNLTQIAVRLIATVFASDLIYI
jgi:hypothetical protein